MNTRRSLLRLLGLAAAAPVVLKASPAVLPTIAGAADAGQAFARFAQECHRAADPVLLTADDGLIDFKFLAGRPYPVGGFLKRIA